VLEETGLKVTSLQYLFSLPNKYIYSGFEEHTLDLFYRCEVEDDTIVTAHDDVCELQWLPLSEINPQEFGLQSIRNGVTKFINEIKKNR
jgi:8-oxo-dGTP pyrophosphatase MutT (NUDIX family)